MRKKDKIGAVLVEGPTDMKVYRHFIDETKWVVMPCNTRENIFDIIGYKGNIDPDLKFDIISILDADYSVIDNICNLDENVFFTDFHDLEILMCHCDECLDKVIYEMGSETKIKNNKTIIRQKIYEVCIPLANFRYMNYKMGLKLSFKTKHSCDTSTQTKTFRYEKFISKKTMDINQNEMIRYVCEFSERRIDEETTEKFKDILADISSFGHKFCQMCNGHDFINTITIALKHFIGTNNYEDGDVAKMIRMAYGPELFKRSDLYMKIISWEKSSCKKLLKI